MVESKLSNNFEDEDIPEEEEFPTLVISRKFYNLLYNQEEHKEPVLIMDENPIYRSPSKVYVVIRRSSLFLNRKPVGDDYGSKLILYDYNQGIISEIERPVDKELLAQTIETYEKTSRLEDLQVRTSDEFPILSYPVISYTSIVSEDLITFLTHLFKMGVKI